MSQVYSTTGNGIRLTINASGLFETIFKTGERNKIIRASMEEAATMLVNNFWGKRFTKYVIRAPFNYPRKPVKLGLRKLRGESGTASQNIHMYRIWTGIKNREFFGWDPWSNSQIPGALVAKWLKDREGEYAVVKATAEVRRAERQRAYADLRRWAKKRVYEYVSNLIEDELILPLVDSGVLRKSATEVTRVKATSTQKDSKVKIITPRYRRQNKLATRILATLPNWEFNAFVRYLKTALDVNIAAAAKNQKPRKAKRPRATVEQRKAG